MNIDTRRPYSPHPETLRVDRDIALREAGKAFDRGDYDAEIRHYNNAKRIEQGIYHAETLAERRDEIQTATSR